MSTRFWRRARFCASTTLFTTVGLLSVTASAQRGGGGVPRDRSRRSRSARRGSSTSGRRARAASRPRPPSPASPACTTRARRRAACGRSHRRRRDLEADVRQRDVAGDRRARRRAEQSRTSSGPAPAKRWAVRDMDMMGDGIYKSTDAGETWTKMGLAETGRIGTIVVHPDQREHRAGLRARPRDRPAEGTRRLPHARTAARRGSTTLFVDQNTGCSGLQMSQQDPNVVIAGTWEIELQTHVLDSGGMGSGIHLSRDGGKTFTKITHPGLPKSPYGKTDVAIAPSDGNRMYALIQTGADGVKGLQVRGAGLALAIGRRRARRGANVSWDRRLIGRAGYYIRIRVSPDDPDHLLIANSTLWRSRDGGKIWASGGGGCGDCHDIWWDTNASMAGHYIVTGDGGMGIFGSPNNPTGNTSVSLPIGQMYRVTVDQRSPYWIYRSRQDDGSMRIASDRPIVPANVPSYAPPPGRHRAAGGGARRWARRRRGAAVAARWRGGGGAARWWARWRRRWTRRRRWRRSSERRRWRWWRRRRTRRRRGRTRAGKHAVVRVRLHVSRAEQPSLRLGHVLRRARRDVRRAERAAPLGQPVDAHARSRSGRPEVPLPLVAAAGDRLVRQLGVLRLPGDLPHARSRPDLGRDQPGSLDAAIPSRIRLLRRRRRRQPRPVLRRGRLGDRAVADAAGRRSGPARTTARSGSRATPAKTGTI